MRMKNCRLIAVALFAFSVGAHGYEMATHSAMAAYAFNMSNLYAGGPGNGCLSNPSTILCQLGVDPSLPNGFKNYYFDVSGTAIVERQSLDAFEKLYWPKDIGKATGTDVFKDYSSVDWIRRGAIREDDDFTTPSLSQGNDSPKVLEVRVLQHFYDPINKKPLNGNLAPTLAPYLVNQTPQKATDWALGVSDALALPLAIDTNRGNHFSVEDAREAEWRALTLTAFDLQNPTNPTPLSDSALTPTISSKPLMRKAYWATLFRSLGDLVHLVQDMAQPQHVRNDSHMGSWYGPLIGAGHKSIYEQYIEARAKREAFQPTLPTYKKMRMTQPVVSAYLSTAELSYSGYIVPVFPDFTSFFTTAKSFPGFKNGLADYTNWGFFSVGTNANSSTNPYLYPTTNFTKIAPVTDSWNDPNTQTTTNLSDYNENVCYGTVYDSYTGAVANVSLTSEGALNEWLEPLPNQLGGYTLTRQNYDDAASLLIPRAVGYSAGLLNHFFLGSMAISSPPSGVYALMDDSTAFSGNSATPGFNKLQLVLTNTSSPDGPYVKNMTGGVVVAVVKYHKNTCFTPNLSGELGSPNNTIANCRASQNVILNGTSSPGAFDQDNSAEDIVVSKAQQLSLDSGANKTLIFDFSANPIPLGASDVYLQVVYRGKLGDGSALATDSDAVVAATQNISEPSYFYMMNSYDYVGYGRDGNPLGMDIVAPITISINNMQAVTLNSFPIQKYIMLAMLVDVPGTNSSNSNGGVYQVSVSGNGVDPCVNFAGPFTMGVVNKFPTGGTLPVPTINMRGVQVYNGLNCFMGRVVSTPVSPSVLGLISADVSALPSGSTPMAVTIDSDNFPN